ncbi:MAG: adenylosuccinate lyase [Zetaproteobacteria bacterium]|nr:adenylosuccinate lyase [Pseudobdellovibrionaceae bacterium]
MNAISPLDGRYRNKLETFRNYVSEGALIKYRIKVELQWLLHLLGIPQVKKLFSESQVKHADKIIHQALKNIPQNAAVLVKSKENVINHDVKAVEYYLKDYLSEKNLDVKILNFIHFACTSEDINNLSYALMLKDAVENFLLPINEQVIKKLKSFSFQHAELSMLSRTHGQTASPTTLGKEFCVFAWRIQRQNKILKDTAILGKINGAVGNYNAHAFVFPEVDWIKISQDFIEKRLKLTWNPYTTQIESHDYIAEYCHTLSRMCAISIDMVRDLWGYISLGYLKQKSYKNEVGSSTMPHKINPIDFENAEGNYGLCSTLANHLAEKLLISRFQRDLSDSTVLRSLGSMVSYFLIGQTSLLKGLSKIDANHQNIIDDLDKSWEVLAEPIQTLLKRNGIEGAYETLKTFSRGQSITKEIMKEFISSCKGLNQKDKERIEKLSPDTYTGLASQLTKSFCGHEF